MLGFFFLKASIYWLVESGLIFFNQFQSFSWCYVVLVPCFVVLFFFFLRNCFVVLEPHFWSMTFAFLQKNNNELISCETLGWTSFLINWSMTFAECVWNSLLKISTRTFTPHTLHEVTFTLGSAVVNLKHLHHHQLVYCNLANNYFIGWGKKENLRTKKR